MGISDRTVQGHLANIYGKLGVASRTEAVTEALKRGWIVPRMTAGNTSAGIAACRCSCGCGPSCP